MRKYTHDLQNLNYYQLMLSSFSNRRDLHALLFSTTKKYHEHFIKVHNALEFIPDSLVAQVVLLLQSLSSVTESKITCITRPLFSFVTEESSDELYHPPSKEFH